MIWLAWRQHRMQLLAALIGFAVVAAIMIVTGKAMHDRFTDSGLAACLPTISGSALTDGGGPGQSGNPAVAECHQLVQQFTGQYETLTGMLAVLFLMLPLFVGLFFGAPLVAREVEQGTHRLVWTQGISRQRWALTKFGLIGAATLALGGAFAALSTWWSTPIAEASGRGFSTLFFDQRGIAPATYTLFAVALGTCAGTIWRQALPAMAVTLVTFLVVRVAVLTLARPRFMAVSEVDQPVMGGQEVNRLHGDWIISVGVHGADGRLLRPDSVMGCPPNAQDCLRELGAGAYNRWVLQPVDRFWTFQWIESGIYLALAALLVFLAVHQVRRRIS